MLETLGYAPGHHEDDAAEDDSTFYNAQPTFTTDEMDTGAVVSEPVNRVDDYESDNDSGAAMLVAQHTDRRTSFIVNSRGQADNLQDLEVFGLERSNSSATGFVVSPPTGAIGSPKAPAGRGGTRHCVGHVGSFEATTEGGQSITIEDVADASGFKDNVIEIR